MKGNVLVSSNRIKQLRTSQGMSQKELADLSEIPQQTLARWELGKVKLTEDMVGQLSTIFKVSPQTLLLPAVEEENTHHGTSWAIYVSTKAHLNVQVALESKIWGFSRSNLGWKSLKKDDIVYLAYDLTWPKEAGTVPKGFPRIATSNLNLDWFVCGLKALYRVRLTSDPYYSEFSVWPDKLYPYRFEFELLDNVEDTYIGRSFTKDSLTLAIMKAACIQGGVVQLGSVEQTNDTSQLQQRAMPVLPPKKQSYVNQERMKKLIREKKEQVLSDRGELACEVCNFSFEKAYGPVGRNFIRVYDNSPSACLDRSSDNTRLDELMLVCSNCYDMLDSNKSTLTFSELKLAYKMRNQ